jgi:hypothetical protein
LERAICKFLPIIHHDLRSKTVFIATYKEASDIYNRQASDV